MGVLVAPIEARRESAWARATRQLRFASERGRAVALVGAATVLAVGTEGYHPFAEDGGIYLAGVKRLLDPQLYPHDAAFAMEPARWSLFAPMVAALVRVTHAPLPCMLLALHVASVWVTLFAAWMLAGRCFARGPSWDGARSNDAARAGAVVLLACWMGLPVAGTALYVMDPYLTARSFATPAMIFAIVGALDATAAGWEEGPVRRMLGRAMWTGGIALCAMMHPLTAMYAAIATAVLGCLRARSGTVQFWGPVAVCAAVVLSAACAQRFSPAESAAYVQAALTRSYWFPSQWRWYELAGLVAPLGILGAAGWRRDILSHVSARCGAPGDASSYPTSLRDMRRSTTLARTAVVLGLLACTIASAFAREHGATHLVARMQPLRMFQIVYVAMIVMLGGWMGERVLRHSAWRWATMIVILGGVMFAAGRAEYPKTSHLESPWMRSANEWVQAFEWARANTPKVALFALDADYIHAPGEDAQSFRAVAERSMLPDASKDGGEASIAPDLAEAWAQGVEAQENLDTISDAERVERLKPLGVTWTVLNSSAETRLECPYANARVRVCRLP